MAFTWNRSAIVAIVAVLVLAGCGDDDAGFQEAGPDDATRDTSTVTTSTNPPPDAVPETGTPGLTTVPPASTGPPTPTTGRPTTAVTGADPEDLDPVVVAAIEDLALTQDRSADEIELVTFERVTWRDGSLGCPQPDRAYTQALVDGYRIVLSFDGTVHHYHGAAAGAPFPCANPVDPAPGGGGGNSDT